MTHLNLTACKKRKRGERVFKLKNFCKPGYPTEFNGPFRQNIETFLEFGHVETKLCEGMRSWSFKLEHHRHPPIYISLFIIEEPIEQSVCRRCNHCQYVGWGHHMICNKKFHFVMMSKETAPAMASCLSCEGSCGGIDATTGKSSLAEYQGHLMHGVLHSNGFGHLICVNGLEMGSELAGNEIMDFWDRICTGLRVRKVSLKDTAKKRSMELRLIHGVAYGEPWFGRWGYRFGRGSFGVTQAMYQKAIEATQGMPLCLLIHHFGNLNHEFPVIFSRYQAMSGHSLLTVGHLFRFMLELKRRLPQETTFMASNGSRNVIETSCRWSLKRVEMATRVIVDTLKKAEFRWVSRQEVRDAARAYIGDTGLLDFVLKSLGNHVVGNYLVRRSVNPITKVLEYCLEDISDTFPNQEGLSLSDPDAKAKARRQITRTQLMKDLFYLYKNIIKEERPTLTTGIFTTISIAGRIILDSKYLIKDFGEELYPKTEVGWEENLKLLSTVRLKNNEGIEENNKALPPYELIILPAHATIKEFKKEVEKSFRETYWGLRSFVVESILNVNAKDTDLVFGIAEGGCSLVVEGRITESENIERIYESSSKDNCVIDCSCGTIEDDGERMISCDICEVWQHTRCVHISNTEDVPHIFLCNGCEHDIIILSSLP